MRRSLNNKIYLLYISLSVLFVMSIATVQFYVNWDEIRLEFYLAPLVVGLLLGYLLATQKILRLRIEAQQSQFVSLVEMAEEFTYLQAEGGDFTYVSSACEGVTGYFPADFYNNPSLFDSLIIEEDCATYREYQDSIRHGESPAPIEVRIMDRLGQLVWVRHALRAVYEDGDLVGYSSSNADISEHIKQKTSLKSLSEEDPLTGLPNRRKLTQELNSLISTDSAFSLVMMDLDRFKYVNDSLGHSYGDSLLVLLTQRLKEVLPAETLMARFGGDEFVFVIPAAEDAGTLIDQVLNIVQQPIQLSKYQLQISASFGWVSFPQDGRDVETLIKFADAAMYDAKQRPGIAKLEYQSGSASYHARILDIEHKLKSAIESGLIQPHYQPIIDAGSGNIVGVESLARWHDDKLGWVGPDEFIPLAEATNLIGVLGLKVLEHAIEAAARLSKLMSLPLYFSVNVSPQQLVESEFAQNVIDLLERYQVPPEQLKLEVTESLFIGGDLQAQEVLTYLRVNGVQIALDDFGTGYSALAVLRDQCIDILKIDRCFVQDLSDNRIDQELVRQIVQMAHMMELKVIAEGVECQQHADYLTEVGCDMLQGYYFGRPMAEKTFCSWLRERYPCEEQVEEK